MLLPSELTAGLLRDMDDKELLAHDNHFTEVMNCQEAELSAITELQAQFDAYTSSNARAYLAKEEKAATRQLTNWTRAAQLTATEIKRRDQEAHHDAHRTHILLQAANYLEAETMFDAALTCRVLAGDAEATAGAGL